MQQKIEKNQLKEKLGEIVPLDRNIDGENYVIAYLGGIAPVKIKTDMSQKEFNKLCGE